jgi:hypothetical protein
MLSDFVINKEGSPDKALAGETYLLATSKKDTGRYDFLEKVPNWPRRLEYYIIFRH